MIMANQHQTKEITVTPKLLLMEKGDIRIVKAKFKMVAPDFFCSVTCNGMELPGDMHRYLEVDQHVCEKTITADGTADRNCTFNITVEYAKNNMISFGSSFTIMKPVEEITVTPKLLLMEKGDIGIVKAKFKKVAPDFFCSVTCNGMEVPGDMHRYLEVDQHVCEKTITADGTADRNCTFNITVKYEKNNRMLFGSSSFSILRPVEEITVTPKLLLMEKGDIGIVKAKFKKVAPDFFCIVTCNGMEVPGDMHRYPEGDQHVCRKTITANGTADRNCTFNITVEYEKNNRMLFGSSSFSILRPVEVNLQPVHVQLGETAVIEQIVDGYPHPLLCFFEERDHRYVSDKKKCHLSIEHTDEQDEGYHNITICLAEVQEEGCVHIAKQVIVMSQASTTESDKSDRTVLPVIVVLIVVGLIVIVVLGLFVCCLRKKQRCCFNGREGNHDTTEDLPLNKMNGEGCQPARDDAE